MVHILFFLLYTVMMILMVVLPLRAVCSSREPGGPLGFPLRDLPHNILLFIFFFNFASPIFWTFGFPTCLYSNNMRNIVNITANNILDCVAPATVENCGTIWEGSRRAVPWVTCNRIHFI